jgi:hypothetical protein
MTDIIENIKKAAEAAAKAAKRAMSDKPPNPVELGGGAEKQPQPGKLLSAPPLNVPYTPDIPGGAPKS